MSRQLAELEQVLRLLITEHGKLLTQLDAQQDAMRAFRTDRIEDITTLQEATRLRIGTLDNKRRVLVLQIARLIRLPDEPTLAKLAEVFPQRRTVLIGLRDELRDVMLKIQSRTSISKALRLDGISFSAPSVTRHRSFASHLTRPAGSAIFGPVNAVSRTFAPV